jgi:hypothetical protein
MDDVAAEDHVLLALVVGIHFELEAEYAVTGGLDRSDPQSGAAVDAHGNPFAHGGQTGLIQNGLGAFTPKQSHFYLQDVPVLWVVSTGERRT